MATTARLISTVTVSTCWAWNSVQASPYHCGVNCSGSQPVNQPVPKELTSTEVMINSTLMTKKTMQAMTNQRHARGSIVSRMKSITLFLQQRGHDRKTGAGQARC